MDHLGACIEHDAWRDLLAVEQRAEFGMSRAVAEERLGDVPESIVRLDDVDAISGSRSVRRALR